MANIQSIIALTKKEEGGLSKAKTEVLKQHKDYLDFVKTFDERIDNFIKITQTI